VIATASELFEARHYPSVVAMTTDALEAEPECVPLLLIRARAHIALRRDLEAQADLRDIIRLDPRCASAFRLLGELAARRDQNQSAAIFFREALRLCPSDQAAADWLQIVEASVRPAAVATKLPAPATAAGRFSPSAAAPAARDSQPRFAKGTQSPDEPVARPTPPVTPSVAFRSPSGKQALVVTPAALEPPPSMVASSAPAPSPARPMARVQPRPISGAAIPELPGFGDYLVSTGILTRERLRAAQAYQRSMKVQLATAIVTLGLATPQRIEWAAVAHQSALRDRLTGSSGA